MPPDSQEALDEALRMRRLPSEVQDLVRRVREYLLHINKYIAKDGQSRDQRFIHKGKYEPDKDVDKDGYVSDDDCVAVLYDVTPGGPRRKTREYAVYYGNVAKLTYDRVGKRVPGPTAHLTERTGEAVCKGFDEKLTPSPKKSHVKHMGKLAYHMKLNNPTGYNDKVEFPMILCGVCMRLDRENDCWLLHPDDYDYTEKQRDRYSKYHNLTAAQQKRQVLGEGCA